MILEFLYNGVTALNSGSGAPELDSGDSPQLGSLPENSRGVCVGKPTPAEGKPVGFAQKYEIPPVSSLRWIAGAVGRLVKVPSLIFFLFLAEKPVPGVSYVRVAFCSICFLREFERQVHIFMGFVEQQLFICLRILDIKPLD